MVLNNANIKRFPGAIQIVSRVNDKVVAQISKSISKSAVSQVSKSVSKPAAPNQFQRPPIWKSATQGVGQTFLSAGWEAFQPPVALQAFSDRALESAPYRQPGKAALPATTPADLEIDLEIGDTADLEVNLEVCATSRYARRPCHCPWAET